MDRNVRPASFKTVSTRHWLHGLIAATGVATTGLAAGLLAPAPAMAQAEANRSMSVPIAATAPERYVVKKGDTLWDISAMYLKQPWYWPEIWYVNPSIANPHLIYPGDVLYFSYVDGKPRVSLERASATTLSPAVRSNPLDGAIRTVPYDVLMKFVGRPTLLEKDQVKKAPYVVGMRDRHIVGSTANEIYGRGLQKPEAGSHYTVVHVGDELRDPDDGDLLGYVGYFAGEGQVIQSTGAVIPGKTSILDMKRDEELTHLTVGQTGREILQGDKLLPASVDVGKDFEISAPSDANILGQVIGIADGVHVAGKYNVVAINRGSKHGLIAGNALSVFYRGEEIRDRYDRLNWTAYTANYDKVRLPDERSATLLVFKVYERMSYALVVESSQVVRMGDFIASPTYGHRDSGTAAWVPR